MKKRKFSVRISRKSLEMYLKGNDVKYVNDVKLTNLIFII